LESAINVVKKVHDETSDVPFADLSIVVHRNESFPWPEVLQQTPTSCRSSEPSWKAFGNFGNKSTWWERWMLADLVARMIRKRRIDLPPGFRIL
jgi:hypothetical protein